MLAGLRLLVVEDHDFQRGAVLRMLEALGATDTLAVADGASALALLETAVPPVDIIISDIDMPGMDGIEFIRRVASSRRPVSMVVVSAIGETVLSAVDTMAAAYGMTLLGVLGKPLSKAKLAALLARHPLRAQLPPAVEAPPRVFSPEEIRQGLAAGQFVPAFQPKVAFASGRVLGFEALARWRHPEAGVLPPRAFLQVMDDNGMIDDLTWVMLRKATACCAGWRSRGVDLCVSVNLSVTSLGDMQLADRVTAIVLEEGLDPRHLVLEITESVAAPGQLGPVLENLARLRLRGFGLSIDDFGTGYASVQQLGRIAFTELKIDRSFVRNAARGEPDMILLRSSLDMAQKLKLVTVAEGVETAAEWDLLQRLGCEVAQGFFIAAPMEPDWVLPWLQERGEARA